MTIMSAVVLIVLALAAPAFADFGPYPATAVRVIDGDTFEMDLALYPGLTSRTRVRLAGVDTPELYTGAACERLLAYNARDMSMRLLRSAQAIMVTVVDVDSFGRAVARIALDGVDLGELLLAANLARKYKPNDKTPWCTS